MDSLNGTTRDDAFSQQVGPDNLIGGIRPEARPAPIAGKPETPQFRIPQLEVKSGDEIDEAFLQSLLPALLDL